MITEKALGVLSKNSYCDVRNVALVSGDGSVGSEMVN